MKKISVREHFRRIARANEEYLEEELARLTIEDASRISALLLASGRYFDRTPSDDEFVPLAELIRRHKERGGQRASRRPSRRRRRA